MLLYNNICYTNTCYYIITYKTIKIRYKKEMRQLIVKKRMEKSKFRTK